MIYLGTTNPGKVREFAGLLTPFNLSFDPVSLDVEETEDTFAENARLKATTYADRIDGIVISEDSGLVIPTLSGLPGVYSARFDDLVFQEDGSIQHISSGRCREDIDEANNRRVLDMMSEVPEEKRGAYFELHLVVADPEKVLFETTSRAHGSIAEKERGDKGFGYDPLFIGQNSYGKTWGELDQTRKNARSHRKKALRELSNWIAANVEALR